MLFICDMLVVSLGAAHVARMLAWSAVPTPLPPHGTSLSGTLCQFWCALLPSLLQHHAHRNR